MIAWRQTSRFASFVLRAAVVAVFGSGLLFNPSPAAAIPVQYVKICSLYGEGFFYLPGTDTCLRVQNGDARDEILGVGVWRWMIPDSQWNWIKSSPRNACGGGKLMKVGDFTGSDLVANDYNRLEAKTPVPLNLKNGQYISSVFYRGGLFTTQTQVADLPACPSPNTTVTDATDASCTSGNAPAGGGTGICEVACVNGGWEFTGNPGGSISDGFCLYYYYPDAQDGAFYPSMPLGCVHTKPLTNISRTIKFTPSDPLPLSNLGPVDLSVANSEKSMAVVPSLIQGKLSVWVCLKK